MTYGGRCQRVVSLVSTVSLSAYACREKPEKAEKPPNRARRRASATAESERAEAGGLIWSHGAWLKWSKKSETPTHTDVCPDCRGRGRRQVGAVDDVPFYERCWRCGGKGEIGAVVVKGARTTDDDSAIVRVAFPIDGQNPMKLSDRGEKPMAKATRIQLAKGDGGRFVTRPGIDKYLVAHGGFGARYRCPVCTTAFDIVRDGLGNTITCPYCGSELAFDENGVLREEKPMSKATRIRLARGGPGAANRCPSCDGPYDVAVSGTGWTTCPHCDTRLHFDGSGEVIEGEVISASAGYGLTPIERRIARQLGVTFDEAQAAKKLYG